MTFRRVPQNRRGQIDRWIVGLSPLLDVIKYKIEKLRLGAPAMDFGPTYLPKDIPEFGPEKIRRGATWYHNGVRSGFHVDFLHAGLRIKAYTGKDRDVTAWIHGKVTEASLKKDLGVCLVAAGLTDLARTEQVRDELFSRTARN